MSVDPDVPTESMLPEDKFNEISTCPFQIYIICSYTGTTENVQSGICDMHVYLSVVLDSDVHPSFPIKFWHISKKLTCSNHASLGTLPTLRCSSVADVLLFFFSTLVVDITDFPEIVENNDISGAGNMLKTLDPILITIIAMSALGVFLGAICGVVLYCACSHGGMADRNLSALENYNFELVDGVKLKKENLSSEGGGAG